MGCPHPVLAGSIQGEETEGGIRTEGAPEGMIWYRNYTGASIGVELLLKNKKSMLPRVK